MKQSRQALREELKDASTEEKKTIIAEYKETNKAKHEEIKENALALKEEIRDNVETEATRTSDLIFLLINIKIDLSAHIQ